MCILYLENLMCLAAKMENWQEWDRMKYADSFCSRMLACRGVTNECMLLSVDWAVTVTQDQTCWRLMVCLTLKFACSFYCMGFWDMADRMVWPLMTTIFVTIPKKRVFAGGLVCLRKQRNLAEIIKRLQTNDFEVVLLFRVSFYTKTMQTANTALSVTTTLLTV